MSSTLARLQKLRERPRVALGWVMAIFAVGWVGKGYIWQMVHEDVRVIEDKRAAKLAEVRRAVRSQLMTSALRPAPPPPPVTGATPARALAQMHATMKQQQSPQIDWDRVMARVEEEERRLEALEAAKTSAPER